MAEVQQYKHELIESLREAEFAFDAVHDHYDSKSDDKNQEKDVLKKALDAMPVFAQAIAVIDAVPPTGLTDLVRDNIVHGSIVSEHRAHGLFGGERTVHRLGDDLKTLYLRYLKGELSIDDERSFFYFMSPYTFENMARTCRSAFRICENIDGIDSRL